MTVISRRHAGLPVWQLTALLIVPVFSMPPGALANEMSGTKAAICAKLNSEAAIPFDVQDRDAVVAFYVGRECRPLWVDEKGPTHAAELVIDELGRADDWGLKASDFQLPVFDRARTATEWTSEDSADAELELTAAVLRYAHEAEGSRIPEPETLLSSYIDRRPTLSTAEDILAQVSHTESPDAVLRSFQPSQAQFLKLKQLLAKLRGKKDAIPEELEIARAGQLLQPGVKSDEVATLKKRFGVASAPGEETVFDKALSAAVKKFQSSAALYPDGLVGPGTRAALVGDSPEKNAVKIGAVIANMDEWRWMPRTLGSAYVFVNIPAFSVRLMKDGKTLFDDRVVVGTAEKQTPVFSKEMKTIVLRPEWNLPNSIKLTALLSGRSIERQGYVVMRNGHTVDSTRVNWAKANLNEYTFYQPAGDDNALGLVKFLFPNKHSVYLHDTPARYLFNERVRLYSHGCVRVRNPQTLAQDIFDIDRGVDAPDVKSLVRKGPKDNEIALATPLPVHVGYFTVWVDADGKPQYFRDYYGHQQRITLALAGQWNRIDVGKDHLAAVDTSALKRIRLSSDTPTRKRKTTRRFDPPMGATRDHGSSRYSNSGGSVGELILRALQF
jgi:murein L,D-transpeptidase YcbB/YkuD